MNATDEQLREFMALSDEDLLRSSQSMDVFAIVESSRRLRQALRKEEQAIKWLTVALVVLTFLLLILGILALRVG